MKRPVYITTLYSNILYFKALKERVLIQIVFP
jgi:hypothetical protein